MTHPALWLALALLTACDPAADTPRCVPGRVLECACPGAEAATQICNENGVFDACACGDAGWAGDAEVAPPPFVLPAACARLIGSPLAEHRLGAVLPLTGALAAFGPGMVRGVELAVEAINAEPGPALALAICDSASNPAQASRAIQALAAAGVPAVVGPAASFVALEAFPEAAQPTGTLLMSPSATAPALSALADDDLFWRTAPSDALQATALGLYLRRQADADPAAHLPVLLVARQDPFGADLAAAFRQAFCPPGDCPAAELTEVGFFGDAAPAAAAIAAAGPDVRSLVLLVFPAELPTLLDGLAHDPDLYLPDALRTPEAMVHFSRARRARLFGVLPAPPEGPAWDRFAAAHQTRFGEAPGLFAAHAWDATHALALALNQAPTRDGRGLAAALRAGASQDHPSAAGVRLFDDRGDAVGAVRRWTCSPDGVLAVGSVVLGLDGRLVGP